MDGLSRDDGWRQSSDPARHLWNGRPVVPFVEETGALVSLFMRLPFGIGAAVPALFGTSADKGRLCVTPPGVDPAAPVALAMTGAWLTAWAGTEVQRAKLCLATFGTLSSAGCPA
jgi:hypothetical protein